MKSIIKFLLIAISTNLFCEQGLLTIEGEISQGTAIQIAKRIEYYKSIDIDGLLLNLNSEGGDLLATIKISQLLINSGLPTTCYINGMALSGGAIIAYACDTIYAHNCAIMGAATPIQANGENATEKIHSAVRAEISSLAKHHNRNVTIALGMVDQEMLIVSRDGEIIEAQDLQEEDIVICNKGKVLSLCANEIIYFGIGKAIAKDLYSIPDIDKNSILTKDNGWKDTAVWILCNPFVLSMLLLAISTGVYLEMTTPGFGIAGGIVVLASCLLMASYFANEIFNILEYISILIGVLLILMEIFLIPGFGLIGLLGIFFTFVGLIGLISPCFGVDAETIYFSDAFNTLGWILLSMLVIIPISLLIFARLSLWYNQKDTKKEQTTKTPYKHLIGKYGITCSVCKPCGTALVEKRTYNVKSENGSLIKEGTKIKIVSVQGFKILISSKI